MNLAHRVAVEEQAMRPVVHEIEDGQHGHDFDEVKPERSRGEAHAEGEDQEVESEIRIQPHLVVDLHGRAKGVPAHLRLVGLGVELSHLLEYGAFEGNPLAGESHHRQRGDVGDGGEPVVGHDRSSSWSCVVPGGVDQSRS